MNKTIYKKSKEIEYNNTDEETVILIVKTGEFFSLNKTGASIFNLVNEKNDFETIIKKMSKKYQTEDNIIRKDVTSFLKELLKKRIIKKND